MIKLFRRLPQGRCGLKFNHHSEDMIHMMSPSARKVWIEIDSFFSGSSIPVMSPSARKVWIEINLRKA